MNNIPEKIYLQIGEDCDDEDFNNLSEVSWNKDKIYENDIEFVRKDISDEYLIPWGDVVLLIILTAAISILITIILK
jgi:hypothetical protein